MDWLLIIQVVIVLAIVELILKGMALWKAGNNRQLGWFIALFILNTAGILPALYILFFQKKKAEAKASPRKRRR